MPDQTTAERTGGFRSCSIDRRTSARAARRGPPRLVRGRDRLAQLRAADPGGPARPGRRASTSGRTPASTGCARLPYRRAWHAKYADARPDPHRRPHPGIRVRAQRRQRRRADARLRRRVPGRHRQRLRRLERLLATTSGRPCTSPTPRAASATTTSARASTPCPRWSSSSCCSRPARRRRPGPRARSTRRASRSPPTGTPCARPETYLGYGRSAGVRVARTARGSTSRTSTRSRPRSPSTSGRLSGPGRSPSTPPSSDAAGARLAFRFQARDVNLVMGPADARDVASRSASCLDGAAPGDAHGFDVGRSGDGTLVEQRLHQLIRQPGRSRADGRDRVPRRRRRGLLLHVRMTAETLDQPHPNAALGRSRSGRSAARSSRRSLTGGETSS